jgi:Xaa-Pro aminopeptidase
VRLKDLLGAALVAEPSNLIHGLKQVKSPREIRYTKTIGRQFNLGPPSQRVRDIYAVVRAAFDACLAEIRDGVPAIVPHEAAKRVIATAGMDRYRLHTTGYSIGAGAELLSTYPLDLLVVD